MKRFLLPFVLLTAVATTAFCQTDEERGKRADAIIAKTNEINFLNEVLPILLSKAQLNSLLTALEVVRANVRVIKRAEYDDLVKLEADLDAAVKAGEEKGEVPGREFTVRLARLFNAFATRRQIAANENIETIKKVVDKSWNAGQKKAAGNAIDIKFFEPGIKPEDLTDAKKLDIYITDVLLNPQAYDVLVKLAKRAS